MTWSGDATEAGASALEYDDSRSLLVLADAEGAERWRTAARTAGVRCLGAVPADGALAILDAQPAADAIALDYAGESHGPLLHRLVEDAALGRYRVLVSAPLARLDDLGRAHVPGVELLAEADPHDMVRVLRELSEPQPPRLHDVNRAQATVRLQQLSEEVGRIANVLAALSEDEAASAAVAAVGAPLVEEGGVEAAFIRSIIRVRRMRDHFFRGELFADPAWDMLLDLMAARVEKQRVAVSSLCIAAAVPPTTALRWIKTLCDQGLFVRIADPEDGRRVYIELSEATAAAMLAYLKSAQRVASLIV